jgi:hypothetical protein
LSDDVMIAVDPHTASNTAAVLDPVTKTLIETARFAKATRAMCDWLASPGRDSGGGGHDTGRLRSTRRPPPAAVLNRSMSSVVA